MELTNLLKKARDDNSEVEDKLRIAEICFNSAPSQENKQVYDEIAKEYYSVRYRLTMLMILELLSRDCDDYDSFREKRKNLLDLIKYRKKYLSELGVRLSIDPFDRVKISEQLDVSSSFGDNSSNINRIKREIAQLTERVEEETNQNTTYMVELNSPEDLVLSKTGMNDIDVSAVSWDVKDYFSEEQAPSDNQVVGIKDIPEQFNLPRERQKAKLVIVRVYDMIKKSSLKEIKTSEVTTPKLTIVHRPVTLEEYDDEMSNKSLLHTEDDRGDFKPQLTIVSKPEVVEQEEFSNDDMFDDSELTIPLLEEEREDMTTLVDSDGEGLIASTNVDFSDYDSDIFKTVIPFEATQMFPDRTDDSVEEEEPVVSSDSLSTEELKEIANKIDNNLELQYSDDEEMSFPEFWVTQEEADTKGHEIIELSFEEQVNRLMGNDGGNVVPLEPVKSDVKTRKKVA